MDIKINIQERIDKIIRDAQHYSDGSSGGGVRLSQNQVYDLALKEAQLEEQLLRNQNLYIESNTLVINFNGKVEYRTPKGKIYKAIFSIDDNGYRLLKCLSQNLGKKNKASDLVKELNKPREGADSPSDDRRVRDTISSIKSKLKLREEDDNFLSTTKGFQLTCDVLLKS